MQSDHILALLEEALRAEPGSIRLTDSLREVEGWDSMGGLATIALIDERLGVTLDAEALAGCETVSDLVALVARGGSSS